MVVSIQWRSFFARINEISLFTWGMRCSSVGLDAYVESERQNMELSPKNQTICNAAIFTFSTWVRKVINSKVCHAVCTL